jgi:hypothetical protein
MKHHRRFSFALEENDSQGQNLDVPFLSSPM